MPDRIRTALWDCETNGLLTPTQDKTGTWRPAMTRVHCLVIRDFERRVTHRFRRNEVEDTIDQGIDLLEDAEFNVGHNTVQFDIPALQMAYDGINIRGKSIDTLVMSRMVFADQKEKDYRLFEAKKLPGALIGQHGLESWGYRLGLHKGDYMHMMEEQGRDPWGAWNQEMEDYCVNDVDVTTLLYEKIRRMDWAPGATVLEHTIHDLMGQQERNGIHFDVAAAEKLAAELSENADRLSAQSVEHYGKWWAPAKKRVVRAMWDDPDGLNKAKKYDAPRAEFGEDDSRAVWGEVFVPKKSMQFQEVLRADRTAGHPFCPVEMKEFNPNSRQQIVDRFVTVYGWNPVDFTETGRPEVSDTVLRNLVGHIPMAEELAEVFFYKKTLGQVATGPQGWLKKVTPEGTIHHYCNVGGTVSGRASHVGPNLGQVPSVSVKEDKLTGKKHVLMGRAGDYGWECRNLFVVPDGWELTGTDLSGIELRCLGEMLSQWDGGAYLDIVLNGDIHTHNQNAMGLPTRAMAKTAIYALIYGGGDVKLGSIVAPLAPEEEQRRLGIQIRSRIMDGIPAFKQLMRQIQAWARKGWLPGLDGRKLWVRAPHAALNLKLQSDAALIAKKWVCLTEEYLEDAGLRHGWDKDYAFLLWVHDETQIASRMHGELVGELGRKAAEDAGLFFGYKCPINAESKVGFTWGATH